MSIIRALNSHRYSVDVLRILKILMVFAFFLFFLLGFLQRSVQTEDFWWHLATGKYIVENNYSLPQTDPFSYTSLDTDSTRKAAILKGNWLAEVIFYKVFSLWEFKGIIILRSLLLLLFLIFVFLTIRKQKISDAVAIILVMGVFFVIATQPERPQLFTFLVFAAVYYLLEDFRVNGTKKAFLIPILVMALSNMHPGYIVCIMLVTIYLAGEGIRYFSGKAQNVRILKGLFAIWGLTIIFSMINPNGAVMLTRVFSVHGEHTRGIIEWMSPFTLFLKKIYPIQYSYVSFLLISLLGLLYFKRIGITHILLLIVFTSMSLISLRYMIFYMCVSAPVIAKIINGLKDEKMFNRITSVLVKRKVLIYLLACILGFSFVFKTIPAFSGHKFNMNVKYSVPKHAADFLSTVNINGNMFNEYAFGGYLIWRLYPGKKVFIDGRGIEPNVLKEYAIVMGATEKSQISWEQIVNKYDISYFITSSIQPAGMIFPMVERLFVSDEWKLIYHDHLSLIFLRNDSGNSLIAGKHARDKSEGLNTILVQASARAMSNPVNPYYLISVGKVFFIMGKFDDAEKAFNMAHERDPDNPKLHFWMERLKESRQQAEH